VTSPRTHTQPPYPTFGHFAAFRSIVYYLIRACAKPTIRLLSSGYPPQQQQQPWPPGQGYGGPPLPSGPPPSSYDQRGMGWGGQQPPYSGQDPYGPQNGAYYYPGPQGYQTQPPQVQQQLPKKSGMSGMGKLALAAGGGLLGGLLLEGACFNPLRCAGGYAIGDWQFTFSTPLSE
jgi:hypothetical protein